MSGAGNSKSNSLFESISLSSTVGNAGVGGLSNIAESMKSTSSTSDDEELDPTEFLSSQSPELLKQDDTNDLAKIPEHSILPKSGPQAESSLSPVSTQSPTKHHSSRSLSTEREPILSDTLHQSTGTSPELVDSMISNLEISGEYDIQNPSGSESPLQYLQENYNILLNELRNNIKLHAQALENGNDNLGRVRAILVDNLHKLSENQYYLHELYEKEADYNRVMCKRFKKWDDKRSRLLNKIASIKSTSNSYGSKLLQLLDDENALDEEINQLETRLLLLKSKKKLLHNEIADTSSVLESKSSKYVRAFQELDNNGRDAILESLKQNGLNNNAAESLIHSIPVDVTFMQHYKTQRAGSQSGVSKTQRPSNFSGEQNISDNGVKHDKVTEQSPIEKPALADTLSATVGKPAFDNGKNGANMGIQAYEIPSGHEPTFTSNTTNPTGMVNRSSAYDHEQGSDAYHKGFSTGFKQSERFKHQLQKIFESYIKPFLEQKQADKQRFTLNVDDNENTVSTKVDLEPIMTFLDHKKNAFTELAAKTGKSSTVYHRYSESWKDICYVVEQREKQLELILVDSHQDFESKVGSILVEALDYLYMVYRDSLNRVDNMTENFVGLLIKQEANGLIKALTMMPPQFSQKQSYYTTKFSQEIKTQLTEETHEYEQNIPHTNPLLKYPESPNQSSYLYNINANAIENVIIKNQVNDNNNGKGTTIDHSNHNKQVKSE